MRENAMTRLLRFITNDYTPFQWIEKITDCGTLGCYTGRVYRKNKTNEDSWHNDMTQQRRVAMSINLSPRPYKGGNLFMRNEKSGKVWEVPNHGFGDMIIFRLSHDLTHMVSGLEGENPKIAYAGWFRAKPDYLRTVKKLKKYYRTGVPI